MALIPDFEIGIWNAWILMVLFFITLSAPGFFINQEAKERTKKAETNPSGKAGRALFLATHAVIMPLALIYSVFLPLKTGTTWLYVGLPVFALCLVMTLMTTLNFAATPVDEPVTRGIYRVSRNPIYLSGSLLYISTGIACASWIFLLFGVLWVVLLGRVVPAEERYCMEKYGDTYREYMNKTPRWIGIPR